MRDWRYLNMPSKGAAKKSNTRFCSRYARGDSFTGARHRRGFKREYAFPRRATNKGGAMKPLVHAISLVLSIAALFCGFATAQTYPSKPITIVVPFSAGGPTDTLARIMGER